MPSNDDCNDTDPRINPEHLHCTNNPNLVVWYRLDDPQGMFATNETSDELEGVTVGTPTFEQEGAYGTAVRFDDDVDSISLRTAVEALTPDGSPPAAGTVELWASLDPLDPSCADDCAHFALHVSDEVGDGFGGNTPDLQIYVTHADPDQPYHWAMFAQGDPGCSIQGPEVEYDTWTHLAVTWNEDGCALLINGVEVGATDAAAFSPTWSRGRIGHPPSRPDRAFPGMIDEVMLFDRARTITELRRDCGRPPCPG